MTPKYQTGRIRVGAKELMMVSSRKATAESKPITKKR